MEVRLLNIPPYNVLFKAVEVCQNTDNPDIALEQALTHGHLSLLEHVSYSFSITGISRACSHQLVRHRMASFAQQSQRFVEITGDDWYVEPTEIDDISKAEFNHFMTLIKQQYNRMVLRGEKLEDARAILPNCTKTDLIMTANCRSLDNFFTLRICDKAQKEIRDLATLMYSAVKPYNNYFMKQKYPKCVECKINCRGVKK